MKYEQLESHTFQADKGRPAIVIELSGGKITQLTLLSGKSGNVQFGATDLAELAAIAAEADKFVKNLQQPKLATE